MKSFLLIGIGRFAHYLCRELANLGNEVVIADSDESKMDDLLDCVVAAKIGDCTRREVLATFGVNNYDACFVCMGSNFQNSLQVTDLLKEMGGARHQPRNDGYPREVLAAQRRGRGYFPRPGHVRAPGGACQQRQRV